MSGLRTCARHTALKLVVNARLKRRAPCNTACEVVTPLALVALFGFLYTLVDISTVPDSTLECDALSLDNQKHDVAYLPRMLQATGQRLAVVGPPAVRAGFLAHLAAYYPGLTDPDVLAALQCNDLALEAPLGLPQYFPPFTTNATLLEFGAEGDLEAYVLRNDYGMSDSVPPVYAAVVFTSTGATGLPGAGGAWAYTLRLNLTDTPVTWQTGQPLDRSSNPDYIANYVATTPNPLGYRRDLRTPEGLSLRQLAAPGFAPLQLAVDRYILNTTSDGLPPLAAGAAPVPARGVTALHTAIHAANTLMGRTALPTMPPPRPRRGAGAGAASTASDADVLAFAGTWLCGNFTATADPAVAGAIGRLLRSHTLLPQSVLVAPFPQKTYQTNGFYTIVANVFALVYCLAYFPAAFGLIRGIVAEKEARLREGMRMMGYSDPALVASWYGTYAVVFATIAAAIVVITKATLFSHSDPGLLFMLFFAFGMSAVSLCWLISTLFSRAKLAAIVGSTLFVAGLFPYFSVNDPQKPRAIKLAGALLSPTAFGLALDTLSACEANGVGLRRDTALTELNGFDFASALWMMLFDTFLYAALAWFLHNTWPQEYGVQRPVWFLCTRGYWFGGGGGCGRGSRGSAAGGGGGATSVSLLSGDAEAGGEGSVGVEAPGPHLAALGAAQRCVTIRGLRKEYSTPDGVKVAVAGVDLDMFEGQIFVLLGHNGAGKSTTIGMITGLTPPTAGQISVFGKDVSTDLSSIRHELGVCPQHDVLWPELTVSEHLRFFAAIKGVLPAAVEEATAAAIREVGLTEKVNARTSQLSGGQKRKLSVAIALIGGSRVVVIDEGSSGMDPYSRRSLWEALQNARAGRVILLTTHFMDEADLLGDRIAIMAGGQVKCCGSSMYLKKLYGVGYGLTLVKAPKCDVPAIEAIVAAHAPAGKLSSNVGAELTFRLPLDASASFPALFAELEARQDALGFTSFGVNVTSLEDVFLRVAEDEEAEHPHTAPGGGGAGSLAGGAADADGGKPRSSGSGYGTAAFGGGREDMPLLLAQGEPGSPGSAGDDASTPLPRSIPHQHSTDWEVFKMHFVALLQKRLRYALRDRRTAVFQLLIPVLALAAGLALLKTGSTPAFPAMRLTLGLYNDGQAHTGAGGTPSNPVAVVGDAAGQALFSTWVAAAGNSPGGVNGGTGAGYGAEFFALPAADFDAKYGVPAYVAATGSDFPCNDTAPPWDPAVGLTTSYLQWLYPGVQNLSEVWGLSQWLLDTRDGTEWAPSTASAAHEYGASRYGAFRVMAAVPDPRAGGLPVGAPAYTAYQLQTNTSMWHALPTFMNVLHSGLLAWAAGGNASSIGITNAPLPFTARQVSTVATIQSFISVLLMVIAVAFIPPTFAVNLVREREVGAKHQQLISGVSLPSYWLSTYAWDMLNYLVPYTVFLICIWGFGITDLTTGASGAATALLLLFYGFAVAPFTYVLSFAFASHSSAQTFTLVLNLLAIVLLIASFVMQQITSSNVCAADSYLKYVYRLFPGFALGNGLMQLSLLKQLPFLETGCGSVPVAERLTRKFAAFDWAVTGAPLTFMALEAVAYLLLAYAIEAGLSYPALRARLWPDRETPASRADGAAEAVDQDVAEEAARVDRGDADRDVVVMRHLRKVYGGSKVAVRDLTMGVRPGELYGHLGVNGAGKSTSLKILSGDVMPTSGAATIAGFDILTQQPAVRRLLGYCPQTDPLLDLLTVTEHLELYARIKGVRPPALSPLVSEAIERMDLGQYANKLAYTLSGGNKRKLSMAIATIGSPSVAFCDEPTTGVDPATKRKLWKVLAAIAARGTSIILVSHSMEECEALCTRIGIMVGGGLRCLGSPQHLKHRHGHGYLGVVKLTTPSPAAVAAVAASVTARLGGATSVRAGDVGLLCDALGAPGRAAQVTGSGSGWALHAALTDKSLGVVEPSAFAAWWAAEDAVTAVEAFVAGAFPGSRLVERHGELLRYTITKARPPQPLSAVFAAFESARVKLGVAEYSVGEQALEDVFNEFAAAQTQERGVARGF